MPEILKDLKDFIKKIESSKKVFSKEKSLRAKNNWRKARANYKIGMDSFYRRHATSLDRSRKPVDDILKSFKRKNKYNLIKESEIVLLDHVDRISLLEILGCICRHCSYDRRHFILNENANADACAVYECLLDDFKSILPDILINLSENSIEFKHLDLVLGFFNVDLSEDLNILF